MAAPSRRHEARRSMLETVATLAGFTVPLRLPDGMCPDVCRCSPVTAAILIGDAKHTEPPGDLYSLGRLERYMRWLRHTSAGGPDFFCVCHPAFLQEGWVGVLEVLTDTTGVSKGTLGSSVLSYDAAVSWVSCLGTVRPAPLPVGQRDDTRHSLHFGV